MTIKILKSSLKKTLNKKKCVRHFDKKNHLYCWSRFKTAKLLATAKQLIRKNSVCFFKNQVTFYTERTYR